MKIAPYRERFPDEWLRSARDDQQRPNFNSRDYLASTQGNSMTHPIRALLITLPLLALFGCAVSTDTGMVVFDLRLYPGGLGSGQQAGPGAEFDMFFH